ncbi:Tetratricopeptide repeat domain 27 [Perkinsus chesapeaki]|uniref:Tetratricopeptide repeat domain 27 n=1 Tax=Perkinsus chesapeaki TaxID=330153 RepID=A0A7J6LG77_PERCH|nr:Tetratricopeptide repeat domain 27 [Perkinsus chesapeaki]
MSSSDLSQAIRSVEAFLIYPHSRYTAPPSPPTELSGSPVYEGARRAAIAVVGAKWEEAFNEPVIAELLHNWDDVDALEGSLRSAASSGPEAELSVLVAAVACLQCFMQANWTGPEVTAQNVPMHPNQRALESPRNSYIMERLEVDGEPLYDVTRGPQLLLTSVNVLSGNMLKNSSLETVPIWRARTAFVWQRMLAEATARGDGQSVTCMKACIGDYAAALEDGGYITQDMLKEVEMNAPSEAPVALRGDVEESCRRSGRMIPSEAVPETVRAVLVLELAIHTSYYGLPIEVSDNIIDAAAKHVGFSWEITGVEGIKRRYQTQAFAQLTCVTKSRLPAPMLDTATGEPVAEGEGKEETAAHQNVQMTELDPDTDILESVKYTSDEFKPTVLHAVEQAILLTKALRLLLSSAADDDDVITMEQIGCLVNRALVLPENLSDPRDAGCSAHWLVYSAGLWLRCRTEFGRVKTRNRAAFQLQALVEQYKDKLPGDATAADLVADRIGYVHSVYYPSLPMLQREFGKRMMEMGMVLSAYDMFVSINMWCEAIDSLIVADRKHQAEKLVRERLEAADTPRATRPRLLCQLGDITGEKKWWQEAWDESGHRYARAMRSLGRCALQSGDRYEAIDCFKRSLEISPLKAGIWFSLGAMYLQVSQYEDAATAFTRALGVDDSDAQSWANLAAAYITMAQQKAAHVDSEPESTRDIERYLKFANTCSYEAVKRARESWRMWQNLLTVGQMQRDPTCMAYAARGLAVDLGKADTILEDDALLKDLVGLSISTGKRRPAVELFETLSKLHGTSAVCHRCLAQLAENDAEVDKQRILQLRHLLPKIHDAKDLPELEFELKELRDCMGVLVEECKKGLGNTGGLSMLVKSAVRKVNVKLQENGLSGRSEWDELQHEIERSSQEIVDLVKNKNKITE